MKFIRKRKFKLGRDKCSSRRVQDDSVDSAVGEKRHFHVA